MSSVPDSDTIVSAQPDFYLTSAAGAPIPIVAWRILVSGGVEPIAIEPFPIWFWIEHCPGGVRANGEKFDKYRSTPRWREWGTAPRWREWGTAPRWRECKWKEVGPQTLLEENKESAQ